MLKTAIKTTLKATYSAIVPSVYRILLFCVCWCIFNPTGIIVDRKKQ